jgi:hypothetical protein
MTQIQSGKGHYVVYFVSENEAFFLYNLDNSDMVLLKQTFDQAVASGKKIVEYTNFTRDWRTAYWYGNSGAYTTVTCYDIYSGDAFYMKVK